MSPDPKQLQQPARIRATAHSRYFRKARLFRHQLRMATFKTEREFDKYEYVDEGHDWSRVRASVVNWRPKYIYFVRAFTGYRVEELWHNGELSWLNPRWISENWKSSVKYPLYNFRAGQNILDDHDIEYPYKLLDEVTEFHRANSKAVQDAAQKIIKFAWQGSKRFRLRRKISIVADKWGLPEFLVKLVRDFAPR